MDPFFNLDLLQQAAEPRGHAVARHRTPMRSAALCCRSAAARAVQVGIAQPTAALTCRKCAKVASPLSPPTAAAPFGGSQSRCDAVCTSRAVPTMLRFLRFIAVPDIPPPFAADVHRLLCLSQQAAAAAVERFVCRRSSRVKVRLGIDTSGWPPVLPAASQLSVQAHCLITAAAGELNKISAAEVSQAAPFLDRSCSACHSRRQLPAAGRRWQPRHSSRIRRRPAPAARRGTPSGQRGRQRRARQQRQRQQRQRRRRQRRLARLAEQERRGDGGDRGSGVLRHPPAHRGAALHPLPVHVPHL